MRAAGEREFSPARLPRSAHADDGALCRECGDVGGRHRGVAKAAQAACEERSPQMNTLTPLLEASLRGALLIGFLVLLRAPLRRLIGSPWLCALWLVVLVRLLLPGSIQ